MSRERPAMITQQRGSWQQEWNGATELVTSAAELLALLAIDPDQVALSDAAARQFPLRVPRAFVERMERGNHADPLLRQVLTVAEEMQASPGFGVDPLAEAEHAPVPGVLHKYRGRVLLVATGACAVHCRYCFRRHFPYQEHLPTPSRLSQALDWLRRHPEIGEIILSGGDPLSLSDRRVRALLDELSGLAHVRRLRIHTRLPVVEPGRLSDALMDMLSAFPLPVVLVLHANHARELAPEMAERLVLLRRAGVTLLNQAVLLRGVNDDADTLVSLSERLFQIGVLPYYLHLLDPVAGAAHFHVAESEARALLQQVRGRLPGYLVPRLAREEPGAGSKTVLA